MVIHPVACEAMLGEDRADFLIEVDGREPRSGEHEQEGGRKALHGADPSGGLGTPLRQPRPLWVASNYQAFARVRRFAGRLCRITYLLGLAGTMTGAAETPASVLAVSVTSLAEARRRCASPPW